MLAKKQNIKQGVDILWIKPKELDKYWSLVQFMIAEGLKFDGNPMDMDVMKKSIATGEYQLFMMELWQENAARMIEKLGRENKCKRIAVLARPGWKNFLEPFGWKIKRYLYQKDLT